MSSSIAQDFEELVVDRFDHPSDIWDSKIGRKLLTEESVLWILSLADWKVSLTLTFRDEKPYDVAIAYFKRLVRYLNKDVFGKQYTKIVKHSYFSYALGIEYQRRGVIHFHALVDRPVNFDKIHKLWNDWAGFAWIGNIRNQFDCVRYIAKYNLKGGQNEVYIAKKLYIPNKTPYWWNDDQTNQPKLFNDRPGVSSGLEPQGHTGRD